MIDLLERFKENEIQNKDDLLYSLQSIYDNFDSDTSAPQARKELLRHSRNAGSVLELIKRR
jgi:hypothetical protein